LYTLYLCPAGLSLLNFGKKAHNFAPEHQGEFLKAFLRDNDEKILMEASAEINSLLRMGLNKDDKIVFLSSDTDDGEMVADCLAKALQERRRCKATFQRISGLQIDDRKQFDQIGIPNLTEAILKEVESYQYQYNIVLNITAGFKATVPYLTFIGMIFNLPIRYIFERSNSIIDLPPIPVEFDKERLKRLEPVIDIISSDYISVDAFREKTGFSYNDVEQSTRDILLLEDGLITLRPTGRILYKKYLQIKGYRVYVSPAVFKKLNAGSYDQKLFFSLFQKMRDPIHLSSKLHPEIKKKGKIDLDCYKAGSTNERIFYYLKERKVYICDIFLHDEYQRSLEQGELLRRNYETSEKLYKEIPFETH